ncbi:MAG: MFS transporter [Planctomycetes bacterium]|jgi:MFS family permease|nr:MFS transporter [Planctomycetota bacterium]
MPNQDLNGKNGYEDVAVGMGIGRVGAAAEKRWYEGVTPYMWLVLAIGSLGWVFDIFEGQIFVASMKEAMPALLPAGTLEGNVDFYNNIAMAAFLVGGALGGVLFGMISDRIGRTTTMILTILMYSLFTCVTAFSQTWWQMILLRFLVALGTGGEWAVASAMIAEVFPPQARARSLGIFHASSVVGTYLAVLAGAFIVGNPALGANAWRWAFVIGAVPAVLTLWIRWKLREPEQWVEAHRRSQSDTAERAGRIADLFAPDLRKNTVLGLILATVGLATFWGVHVYGRDLLRAIVERSYLEAAAGSGLSAKGVLSSVSGSIKRWEMLGMFLVTTGGGLGLLSFGPLCERLGRRATFLLFQAGGLLSALIVFQGMARVSAGTLCWMLPLFGFMTLGLHAGYAIYFPELFPTRLRGTGGGFCFNGGRFLAASILIVRGWMRSEQGLGLSLESTASILSLLWLVGILVLSAAPETKGRALPE